MGATNPMGAVEVKLLETMDAVVWTKEFLRLNPDCGLDFQTMIGWFANSIMVGYDHHRYQTRAYQMQMARLLHPWWNWRHYVPYKRLAVSLEPK